ncbi:hypothetical protein HZQ28_10045 [Elizabethkingia anophelis]|nr:hypothetical protein [Elizabethkingia anophelis]QQM28623.1 hypothetical protein JCR23_01205 [Elizabethkingia sp. M8]MCT3950040.1 hypothetical protein [Elizabethkingia anophelis]MCT3994830.1 hypothetical protein [Elizabethkingia anophelis]MCT3998320.1 hypothetical protein [Elizabethkingia anophelis]
MSMVKKSTLEKFSDQELKKYIAPESRFTPEAVQMALEILKERGNQFSDQESVSIQKMIQEKKDAEIAKINEDKEQWEDNITDDPNAIKLYPLAYIVVLSTLFGTIPGALLLALNFMKIKKYTSVIFVLLFGLIYPFVQYYLLGAISTLNENKMYSRYSPETFIMISGGLSLYIISALVMPKKLPYRAESLLLPALLAFAMALLIYMNPQNLFSYYLLSKIITF